LRVVEQGEDLQVVAHADPRITGQLTEAEIAACFDDRIYVQHAGMIIDRALAYDGS